MSRGDDQETIWDAIGGRPALENHPIRNSVPFIQVGFEPVRRSFFFTTIRLHHNLKSINVALKQTDVDHTYLPAT